jgi:hypothetical protein
VNDTTTILEIPEASMKEIESVTLDAAEGLYDGRHELHARRIAAPIVAAELRRMADAVEDGADGYLRDGASDLIKERCQEDKYVARKLRARADELDGRKTL